MIVTKETDDGYIYGYAVFQLVDDETKLSYPDGKYVYVQDIWVHEDYRNDGTLNELILDIFRNSENAEYVYWCRGEYGRVSPQWHISRLLRFMKE